MTNLQKKLTTALATGAVLANAFVPVAFAAELTISGNGSNSDSDINVNNNSDTTVAQTNTANVRNTVNVNADTGNNSASDNTGGDVRVRTGDANTDVNVKNILNSNVADVQNCGGCNLNYDLEVSGNGTRSDNKIDVDSDRNVALYQTNNADVDNNVDVNADSGSNDVNDNTGGDVTVRTGDIDTEVRLKTVANANSARIGGGSGSNAGGISARILGNGSESDNDIYLDFNSDVLLTQTNFADVDNHVDVDADTGYNDVNDNTGGSVALLTGDADATVVVDNMVNFNAADIDNCGCGDLLTAKIAGNGTHSDNKIDYDADKHLDTFQTNRGNLYNRLNVDGDTGDNDVEDNTGEWDGSSDPFLQTGDSGADVRVANEGGLNVFGNVAVELDWNDLWDWFNSLAV